MVCLFWIDERLKMHTLGSLYFSSQVKKLWAASRDWRVAGGHISHCAWVMMTSLQSPVQHSAYIWFIHLGKWQNSDERGRDWFEVITSLGAHIVVPELWPFWSGLGAPHAHADLGGGHPSLELSLQWALLHWLLRKASIMYWYTVFRRLDYCSALWKYD